MEEQNQNSVNLEIPSRWRRFSAYLLDLLINIILWCIIPYTIFIFTDWIIVSILAIGLPIIWLFTNIILIFVEKTTLWNMLVWIKTLNNKKNSANLRQALLRYLIFYQTLPLLVYYFCRYYYTGTRGSVKCWGLDCIEAKNKTNMILWCICLVFSVMILINVIELFFKCPTFIDKRLWIKRIYKKSK